MRFVGQRKRETSPLVMTDRVCSAKMSSVARLFCIIFKAITVAEIWTFRNRHERVRR